MILLVAYDLHQPGRDYPRIEEILEAADGSWAHPQGSVWLLDTQDGPDIWRDRLKDAGDPNDEYFVVRLWHHWAGYNTDEDIVKWLKDPSRSW